MEEKTENREAGTEESPRVRALVVIDMQNDFITGSLGSAEAVAASKAAADRVAGLISAFQTEHVEIASVCTFDCHRTDQYSKSLEGQRLPVLHCTSGTYGGLLSDDLSRALSGTYVYQLFKSSFGAPALPAVIESVVQSKKGVLDSIDMMGLCTDICVISNALLLRTAFPDTVIRVHRSCCAGSTPEKHEHALDVMLSCMIDIVD